MAVITISRQFGAGGHTLGGSLAARLGYQLVDRELLLEIARQADVSIDWVEAVREEAGGLMTRLIDGLVSSRFIERVVGDSASYFDEKKYIRFFRKVTLEVAREGDVVFVGGGNL